MFNVQYHGFTRSGIFWFQCCFELSAWTELFFLPAECGVTARGVLRAGQWSQAQHCCSGLGRDGADEHFEVQRDKIDTCLGHNHPLRIAGFLHLSCNLLKKVCSPLLYLSKDALAAETIVGREDSVPCSVFDRRC